MDGTGYQPVVGRQPAADCSSVRQCTNRYYCRLELDGLVARATHFQAGTQ